MPQSLLLQSARKGSIATERHFTVQELAELWGVSRHTIARRFENQAGVLVIGHGETKAKRPYRLIRIPQSVAERVHQDMSL